MISVVSAKSHQAPLSNILRLLSLNYHLYRRQPTFQVTQWVSGFMMPLPSHGTCLPTSALLLLVQIFTLFNNFCSLSSLQRARKIFLRSATLWSFSSAWSIWVPPKDGLELKISEETENKRTTLPTHYPFTPQAPRQNIVSYCRKASRSFDENLVREAEDGIGGIVTIVQKRRAFLVDGTYIRLGPQCMEVDDLSVMVFSCRMPLILRPRSERMMVGTSI